MFFNNRRRFLLSLGLGGLGLILGRRLFAQSVRLDITKQVVNGTNVLTLITDCESTNIAVEILRATDVGSTNWANIVSTENVVRQRKINPYTTRWDIAIPTNQFLFFRSVLLTSATMKVAGKLYEFTANGESLFVAMLSLPSFTFKSQLYAGLGQFVTEISGVKRGGGLNWILFLNGQSATVGSSQVVPKVGDKIEWRLI